MRHSARKTIQEIVLNKSTRKPDLFQDVFHNQRVHVGDRLWSRHLVAETSKPAKLPAVPTEGVKPSERTIRTTGHYSMENPLPKVDGGAGRELKEEMEKGQQEMEKRTRDEEMKNDAQEEVCTPLRDLQNLYQTWEDVLPDEFEDIADLAEEMEDLEEPQKETSALRRFLDWLNERLHDRTTLKIARTYRRELEEGHRIYRCKIFH